LQLRHFQAFAPICPVCVRAGRAAPRLVLAHVAARTDSAIQEGTLHCPSCQHEYPVLDFIPIIVPDLAPLLAERGVELLLRDDLEACSESLLGDAFGPDSWFDVMRQVQSTYGWDAYADLDPQERAVPDGPVPGAARRCLAQLLALRPPLEAERLLDIGCAAGRTAFTLAEAHAGALVLGVDIHLGLLRLAQRAAGGMVSYPRRRIGLVYDRRRFAVDLPDVDRVDFWACDALALPFSPGIADLCVALNVLDCVANPRLLLENLAASVRSGGHILLATPYDWSARATPLAAWLGGHSQRAAHAGAGEAFFHALLTGGAEHAIPGLACLAEQDAWPWQTRLHDRGAVQYRTHLAALVRR
jgi:SAM-dependent methyltransferase